MSKYYKCLGCGGDGKETCHNPDHGFYGMIGGIVGANESACPCCGHDPNHKVKNGGECEYCSGTGIMTEEEYGHYIDNNDCTPNYEEIELEDES